MEPAQTDSYFIESYYEEEDMAERVTVSVSRKASDGAYGSYQANIGLEDDVPPGVSKDSHAAGMRAWCKAFLDETVGDMRDAYEALENFESASEAFAEEVGATVTKADVAQDNREKGFKDVHVEEKPPLPQQPAKPSPSDTDYRKTFRIQSFEVAQTQGGDKYLKCFGKAPWKRAWVPAWSDVAELLFGDINDMDLGVVGPPYDLDAVVQMKDDEWKGKKYIAPDKVIEWEQVR